MRKKVNKSAKVRDLLAKYPDKNPQEIAKIAKTTSTLVYQVKSALKFKKKQPAKTNVTTSVTWEELDEMRGVCEKIGTGRIITIAVQLRKMGIE